MDEGQHILTGKTSKGQEITLRYPMLADMHALWEFINTLSQERTFILFQGETITLEDEEKYLKDSIAKIALHKRVQVLAFIGDQLAGNAEVSLDSGVSAHVGRLGIAVAQSFRGKGVGEILMQTVVNEAAARLTGIKMVTLSVFGHNEVGQNLYRKLGFIEYGRLPGGVLHGNQFVDMVYMMKPVNASGSYGQAS